jgi:adenosylcobinamide kinase / adenosylcobinamide-phosphate guanylyltransferase
MAAGNARAFYCSHTSRAAMSVELILGGARSGKSRFAEGLAAGSKYYVATAQAFDDEMRERIAAHRLQRGAQWFTTEEPLELVDVLRDIDSPSNFILVDCLTLWLSNLLLAERDCWGAVADLCGHLHLAQARIVLVSNEVGLGIVPDNELSRRFRDLQGFANQRVAAVAENVVFMAAGLPLLLKGRLPKSRN